MPKTSVNAIFNFNDNNFVPIENSTQASVSSTSNNTIGNIDMLLRQIGDNSVYNFFTLEHNINILDGSFYIYNPDNMHMGYLSNTLSNNNCEANNTITISFSSNTSEINNKGFILNYGDNKYLSNTSITYKYISNDTVYTDSISFSPNSYYDLKFFEGNNINEIVINLGNTMFPRMYSRLFMLTFNLEYIFTSDKIESCIINEELSPISQVLPINTGEIVIYSELGEYNLINNSGLSSHIVQGQVVDIIGLFDDVQNHIYTFYIDKLAGVTNNSIKINLVSATYILDNYNYIAEAPLQGRTNSIIDDITTNINEIQIDINVGNEVYDFLLIKNGKVRDALREFLFLVNGIIIDRGGNINIVSLPNNITTILYPESIFDKVEIEKLPEISGVSVQINNYAVDTTTHIIDALKYDNLYNGSIPVGGKTFTFDTPVFAYRYKMTDKNGGAVQDSESNPVIPDAEVNTGDGWSYVTTDPYIGILLLHFSPSTTTNINIENTNFIIEVNYFIHTTDIYTLYSSSQKGEMINISTPSIFTQDNVEDFANNILEYYKNSKFKIQTSYVFDGNIHVGDIVYIYTEYEQYLRARVVKQSIDLGNGFISKITCVGCSFASSENYFTTYSNWDLIMGDNIII